MRRLIALFILFASFVFSQSTNLISAGMYQTLFTGFKTATDLTVVNDESSVWGDPNNAKLCDGSYATTLLSTGEYDSSDTMIFTNFGFTIPEAATIIGIIVRGTLSTTYSDDSVYRFVQCQLYRGGVPVGDNNALIGYDPTEIIGYLFSYPFGWRNSLWGETWTATQLNDSGFGFVLKIDFLMDESSPTLLLDCIEVGVYYDE